jgi:hypothetical protein
MTWIYQCSMEGQTFAADTKEHLVEKVQQHAQQFHALSLTHDEAQEMVERHATQVR